MAMLSAYFLLPVLAAGIAFLMATYWGMDTPTVRKTVAAGYLIFADVTGPSCLLLRWFGRSWRL
jgi:hypothetical protein